MPLFLPLSLHMPALRAEPKTERDKEAAGLPINCRYSRDLGVLQLTVFVVTFAYASELGPKIYLLQLVKPHHTLWEFPSLPIPSPTLPLPLQLWRRSSFPLPCSTSC